jgi:site-specific DNA-methyltransferase (adenine-specific)
MELINTITHGDFREVSPLLESKSVDFVLHDFPYGITRNKWDENHLELLNDGWRVIDRVGKDRCVTVAFGVQPYVTDLILSNRNNFKYDLVWNKVLTSSPLNVNRMPLRVHEQMNIFYKKPPIYTPIKTIGHPRKVVKSRNSRRNQNFNDFQRLGNYDSTERFPTSLFWETKYEILGDTIFTVSNGGKRSKMLHPTEKPLDLVVRLLETYTQQGDLCLDLTSGSGVLAEACIRTGRNFICIEKDLDMVKKSEKRVFNWGV